MMVEQTIPAVSKRQIEILKHAIGDNGTRRRVSTGQSKRYRNYFCTNEGCQDYYDCRDLTVIGLMEKSPCFFNSQDPPYPPKTTFRRFTVFRVTRAGLDYLGED